MGVIIEPCPFCGDTRRLDLQFRQAKKTRWGYYDAAIYCRNCYCYGPRIRSEDILPLVRPDVRNESPTPKFKDIMREAALKAWNERRKA